MTMRILVGDDNRELLNNLERAMQVDTAYTPEQVIEKAKIERYDVIITDLEYTEQGREGFEVLREIRELSPVRVLFTAKANMSGIREEAEKYGATHVMNKDAMNLIRFLRSQENEQRSGENRKWQHKMIKAYGRKYFAIQ